MALLPGYTVGDELGRILQLADKKDSNRSITYAECGELLEQKLRELFSNCYNLEELFAEVKLLASNGQSVDQKNYCYSLAAAGVRLGRAFAPSSGYLPVHL